jgi:exopolyphosphatase / guanosine-5'-triphosphate,3'-diphosphate pyrophosphatase
MFRSAPHPQTAPRVAVIDIGSNSVRLVVFEGPPGAPVALLNEKAMCGLGRTVEEDGRLDPDGVVEALATMQRFARLAEGMGVTEIRAVATSAVRDASDGPKFVAEVQRQTGIQVRVITGAEEAEYSAHGVLGGIPDADGAVGDIGGGSLELVLLNQGRIGDNATLPVGALRLMRLGGRSEMRKRIVEGLETVPWLGKVAGRQLYLVGGAWRAIARLHMAQARYPLRIIQHYRLPADAVFETARLLSKQSAESLGLLEGVPKRRLEEIPPAALVLQRLIDATKPAGVVFSAHGLREGLWFRALSPAQRREHPFIAACRDMAAREGRFGDHGDVLDAFVGPLFAGDPEDLARLRLAACLLSDVAWNVNPDYRADHAFGRLLHAPFSLDHEGRVRLALALFARYQGSVDGALTGGLGALAGKDARDWAERLGRALRLAYGFSGGSADILSRARLSLEGRHLTLEIPAADSALVDDGVRNRLENLAGAVDRPASIKIGGERVTPR